MSGIVGSRFNIRGSGLVGSLGTDGQVFTSSGAGAGAVFEAAAGGDNTPAFMATATSEQAFSDDTITKMQFGTELYDTDSTYSSDRFTPAVAAKYQIFGTVDMTGDGDYQRLDMLRVYLYKNGSSLNFWTFDFRTGTTPTAVISFPCSFNTVVDADDDDYYEVYGYADTRTVSPKTNDIHTLFGAYKIIT